MTLYPLVGALTSVAIVSLLSLIGALLWSCKDSFLRKATLILVGLSTGAMFGDAFIHLIPEAFEEAASIEVVSVTILAGILVFFIFEKFLHWHHYHDNDEKSHDHSPHLSPMILVSDALHNLIDGIVIVSGFLLGFEVGVATTIAVILHELPQEIGDFGLLVYGGMSKGKALLWNFVSALTSFVGVGIGFLLSSIIEDSLPYMAAFAAGSFIYIAGSDLVPELHKHKSAKVAVIQLLAMIFGSALMFVLLFLE